MIASNTLLCLHAPLDKYHSRPLLEALQKNSHFFRMRALHDFPIHSPLSNIHYQQTPPATNSMDKNTPCMSERGLSSADSPSGPLLPLISRNTLLVSGELQWFDERIALWKLHLFFSGSQIQCVPRAFDPARGSQYSGTQKRARARRVSLAKAVD